MASDKAKGRATATKFCACIKHVRKTLKALDRRGKEQRAIAICVKSVLHTRKKTLRRFTCKAKKMLETQNRLVKNI
jgi:hypothetical protein